MGNRRIRHNKFFKVLTICGASLGLLASTTFSVLLGLDATGKNNFIINDLRKYTAKFINEGVLISEATYSRGEEIEKPENPIHDIDGENNYFFIGWDTTGNGLPDVIQNRIYYSFTAEAVYLKTGKFDLSFLDLTNMDLEKLLELLEKLNIDWEQFMDMFNIDPETLMQWLMENSILTFEADASRYLSYFRSTSYGDYNYKKKQFDLPGFYDSSNIGPDSINPLSYTADKLKNAYDMTGTLPDTFDFINYDITFNAKQDYYPVPDCEYTEDQNNSIDSDAHYLKQPVDGKYYTHAAYVPAMNDVIDLLSLVPFSNNDIKQDEAEYYQYAKANYTKIPSEYEEVIDGIIKENDWWPKDYSQVNSIGAYVENLGACSMFKDGEVNLSYKKNKDPVNGLIDNKEGSDLDFNTTEMMIFRRLDIPARIVKGYLCPNIQQGTNVITLLQQHYWCEIYVKNIGWMICDCMNAEEFLGTNPYGDLDKQSNPLIVDRVLDSITVTPPNIVDYQQYDDVSYTGMTVTANYSDGTSELIPLDQCQVAGYYTDFIGSQSAIVYYTENGITKSDSFDFTVTERRAYVVSIDIDITQVDGGQFYTGQTFNHDGLTATATYSDDSVVDVTNRIIILDPPDMNVAGYYEITAQVIVDDLEETETYHITVLEDYPTQIIITNGPTDDEYYTGQEFDPTGVQADIYFASGKDPIHVGAGALGFTTEEFTFNGDKSSYPTTEEVKATYEYEMDGMLVTLTSENSIEVTVQLDTPTSATVSGYNSSYTIGDSFNVHDVIDGDSMYTITMASGTEITINANSDGYGISEGFTMPDLGTIDETGTAFMDVLIDTPTGTVHAQIPYTVSPVNESEFSVSPGVSTAGPGNGMSSQNVFNYTSSKTGMMYFRNASYEYYNPGYGWSNTAGGSTINSNKFTYNLASKFYGTSHVEIEYLTDVQYGLTPVYCDAPGTDRYAYSTTIEEGTINSFDTLYFSLNEDNYKYLMYLDHDSNIQQQIYDYGYPSMQGYSCSDGAKTYIKQIVDDDLGYSSYFDFSNDEERITAILAVKNYLQDPNNFRYDINFKYPDPSKDPIESFFEEGVGICNNFASAATMIYRYMGIPARFVVGFGATGNGGTTTVTTNEAHAWTEVYLQSIGWVMVDATGYDIGQGGSGSGQGIPGGYYGDGFDDSPMPESESPTFEGIVDVDFNLAGLIDLGDGTYRTYYNCEGRGAYYDEIGNEFITCQLHDGELPAWIQLSVHFDQPASSLFTEGWHTNTVTLTVTDLTTGLPADPAIYHYTLGTDSQSLTYRVDKTEISFDYDTTGMSGNSIDGYTINYDCGNHGAIKQNTIGYSDGHVASTKYFIELNDNYDSATPYTVGDHTNTASFRIYHYEDETKVYDDVFLAYGYYIKPEDESFTYTINETDLNIKYSTDGLSYDNPYDPKPYIIYDGQEHGQVIWLNNNITLANGFTIEFETITSSDVGTYTNGYVLHIYDKNHNEVTETYKDGFNIVTIDGDLTFDINPKIVYLLVNPNSSYSTVSIKNGPVTLYPSNFTISYLTNDANEQFIPGDVGINSSVNPNSYVVLVGSTTFTSDGTYYFYPDSPDRIGVYIVINGVYYDVEGLDGDPINDYSGNYVIIVVYNPVKVTQ